MTFNLLKLLAISTVWSIKFRYDIFLEVWRMVTIPNLISGVGVGPPEEARTQEGGELQK